MPETQVEKQSIFPSSRPCSAGSALKATNHSRAPSASMASLLAAIVADDRARARQLLKAEPGLATALIKRPRLFQSKIFHWIYAGDTPLHLAAAGYRVEIVRLLLKAGADPNAAMNHRHSGP